MCKEAFPPAQDWFNNFQVRVDLGFFGFEKDYVCKELLLPNRKKKKQELSPEQKQENKLLASERIAVEHAIGGMKRYRILSDRLRVQDVTALSSGVFSKHLVCQQRGAFGGWAPLRAVSRPSAY